ncbi:MAG: hypothetical protein ACLUEQ_10200 [Cloacibacillus evryensis]
MKDGRFSADMTMDEMIESLSPYGSGDPEKVRRRRAK